LSLVIAEVDMARENVMTTRIEYVRGRAIAEMLDVSLRTVYRKVAKGELPQPVHIGSGTTRWRLSDVQAHLDRIQPR
jgi:excisionase family DNA binding protein